MPFVYAFIDEQGHRHGEDDERGSTEPQAIPFVPPSGPFEGQKLELLKARREGGGGNRWLDEADCYLTEVVEELLALPESVKQGQSSESQPPPHWTDPPPEGRTGESQGDRS